MKHGITVRKYFGKTWLKFYLNVFYLPQMFLCQNFIPTNGVSLLSNKFNNRSTESQKSSKNKFLTTNLNENKVFIYIKICKLKLPSLP